MGYPKTDGDDIASNTNDRRVPEVPIAPGDSLVDEVPVGGDAIKIAAAAKDPRLAEGWRRLPETAER
jgi:hypothetical protein